MQSIIQALTVTAGLVVVRIAFVDMKPQPLFPSLSSLSLGFSSGLTLVMACILGIVVGDWMIRPAKGQRGSFSRGW